MTRAFSIDRCSVIRPNVEPGQWIAYFTAVGKPRWLRALVVRHRGHYVIALDEDGDLVAPERWERVYQPPALRPRVLSEWLRVMAICRSDAGPLG